jgi:putative redox protein
MIVAKCAVTGVADAPNFRHEVRCGKHHFIADEHAVLGGADAGPSPFDYLLAGLGACTSITLRMYAQRKGWDIGNVSVTLSMHQDETKARSIERHITLSGALTDEQHQRLAEICEKTPVTLAVKAGVPIKTTLVTG